MVNTRARNMIQFVRFPKIKACKCLFGTLYKVDHLSQAGDAQIDPFLMLNINGTQPNLSGKKKSNSSRFVFVGCMPMPTRRPKMADLQEEEYSMSFLDGLPLMQAFYNWQSRKYKGLSQVL